jgi:hypothetical protein
MVMRRRYLRSGFHHVKISTALTDEVTGFWVPEASKLYITSTLYWCNGFEGVFLYPVMFCQVHVQLGYLWITGRWCNCGLSGMYRGTLERGTR